MSAALAVDPVEQVLPADVPERRHDAPGYPRRPDGRPALRLVSSPAEAPEATARIRLSRRGRLLRAVLVVVGALALVWTAGASLASVAPHPRVVTVSSGETLWELAARELPDLSTREGVARIRLANGLNTPDIHTGQVLQIPAEG